MSENTKVIEGMDVIAQLDQIASAPSPKVEVKTVVTEDEIEVIKPPVGYRFAELREKNLLKFYEYYDIEETHKSIWHLYDKCLNSAAKAGFFEEPPQLKINDVFSVKEQDTDRIMREIGELMPDTTEALFTAVSNYVQRVRQIPKN